MAKSNSFVVVSMVGAVALVAFVVLLSPNMKFDDNVAGQAYSFEKDYNVLSVYEKDSAEKELVAVDVIAAEYYEEDTKEESVAIYVVEAEYYEEEPKLEVATDKTIATISYDGEGVSDDPAETGEAKTDPYETLTLGDPITEINTGESGTIEGGDEPISDGVDYGSVEGTSPVETYTCSDDDGGSRPTILGTTAVYDSSGAVVMSHTDYCDSGRLGRNYVFEGTCNAVGEIKISRENCGHRCRRGAC